MNASLVMTLIGADRPGLVGTVAAIVQEHGGNWTESRMARLAGQFAGILRIEVPIGKRDALIVALTKLRGEGLAVVVEAAGNDATTERPHGLHLELVGHDRPGIVHQITSIIRRHGINIEELETAIEPAPMADGLLFKAKAALRAPANVSLDALRRDLEEIATELMVDLTLTEPGRA